MLFGARAVAGFGGGGIGVTQSLIADVTPEENRDRAYAMFGAVFGLGIVLGPILGGSLIRFGFAVPFFVAIVLNELRHAKGYLRCLVYLPVMLPPASALLLFSYFYDPTYGLFNDILHTLHLPTSQWVLSSGTRWPTAAMISVVIAATWMNMGGATLIYLAALQNIPGELYEAAELDGAGIVKKIRHITIPQTKLVLSMLLMLQIIATMQMFVEAFILDGGQGVNNNTESVVYLIYQYAFAMSSASNFNSAAALGVVLLVVLATFSGGYVWLTRTRDR